MKNFRNPIAASIIFTLLILLSIAIYDGFSDSYDLTYTDVDDTESFAKQLNNTLMVSSINQLTTDFSEIAGASNALDLVGNLLASGLGIIKTVFGILLFPPKLLIIILKEYNVPEIVGTMLTTLITLYVGFILVSAYLQRKV